MSIEFFIAVLGLIVTAAGWVVVSQLDRQREDRRRRLENRLEYAKRQIEDFYGPLFNLAHQIFLANHVQHEILSYGRLNADQERAVGDFFQQQHFITLHKQINEIIKSKLHLIHGTDLPSSFYLYMKHSLQEFDQRQLFIEHGVDTSFVQGSPWPANFYNDLEEGLKRSLREYEEAASGLR